jgi:hypothetical protein
VLGAVTLPRGLDALEEKTLKVSPARLKEAIELRHQLAVSAGKDRIPPALRQY